VNPGDRARRPVRTGAGARGRGPLARGRRGAAAVAFATAALLAGCGGIKAPDLFIVNRTGSVPGARLTLLVNEEGGVRCNGGPERRLSDPQLVQARAIEEDLHGPTSSHLSLAPGAGAVFSYEVRDERGTARFSDDSAGQPTVLRRLALFVLQTAQHVCHLAE
jgi:hypothetical protein